MENKSNKISDAQQPATPIKQGGSLFGSGTQATASTPKFGNNPSTSAVDFGTAAAAATGGTNPGGSGGLFGNAGTTTTNSLFSNTGTSGGLFGNTSSSAPSTGGLFGAPAASTGTSGSLFQTGSLFGQTTN